MDTQPESSVHYMQLMIGDYRTIIFVDGHSIKTTNTKSVKLVAGSANQSGYRDASGKDARFYTIPSFVQLDGNNIVAVDQGNHCLRLITLDGKVTKRYSGVCTEAGRNMTGSIKSQLQS